MGRLIAVVTACTLLVPAAPAAAAELTRVVSSGEVDHAFGMDLSVRWDRTEQRAAITREYAEASSPGAPASPFATVQELQQLGYAAISNLIVPRIAVGLWEDLELHAEVPWILSQETTWKLASGVGGPALPDTIAGNTITPDGTPCAGGPCPIFPTSDPTVYQGGVAGDLVVGLSWGPFMQRRDDTKPDWVVGVDVTVPTAKLYDPAAGRTPYWDSPYSLPTVVGPVGQKVWRYDLHTAMSRRLGTIEPYVRAHLTLMQKSSATYSNCDHAAEMAAPPPTGPLSQQARADAASLCAADPGRWGARLPWLAGLTFGTELVPYEDRYTHQKFAVDLRLTGDYTSSARWYNELTDATGRLLATEAYLTLVGRVGLVFRASEYVAIQAAGSFGWVTSHLLTGEALDGWAQNPNFDWRYDAPGRRFRATEETFTALSVTGALQF